MSGLSYQWNGRWKQFNVYHETNGTLRTAVEFDYESYQTLSIRVKAMDGNFIGGGCLHARNSRIIQVP